MENKVSIWKRFGDWLRRSQEPAKTGEVVHLDAEGGLVETNNQIDESAPALAHSEEHQKPRQLSVMEEAYNRLVDVLESINDNLHQQRLQGSDLKSSLDSLHELLKSMPESLDRHNKLAQDIAQQIRQQNLQNQRVNEIMQDLPELARKQVDKLADIDMLLENSTQSQSRIADSFLHFDQSLTELSKTSNSQNQSISHINQLMQQSQEHLRQLVSRQNRRFNWMLAIFLIISIAFTVVVIMLLVKSA